MKRSRIVYNSGAVLLVLTGAAVLRSRAHAVPATTVEKASAIGTSVIAAPGRVEAVSEEIRVSSELTGRLKTVNVEEGDRVQCG